MLASHFHLGLFFFTLHAVRDRPSSAVCYCELLSAASRSPPPVVAVVAGGRLHLVAEQVGRSGEELGGGTS